MKVTYIGHAGLYIETEDCNILCDPWVHSNPAFFNSWYVYPENNLIDWEYLKKRTTHLYVSHVHRDHFDEKFLSGLFNVNKSVQVILPDYKYADLKERFCKIGAQHFNISTLEVGGTRIYTYVCETFDREREDSALLVSDVDMNFLNVNDSKILPKHKKHIFKNYGHIHMMACQASGASYYPNSYNYTDEEKLEKCDLHRSRVIDRFLKLKDDLKVDKAVITAGPPIILDKGMTHLNFFGDNASVFHDPWEVEEFNEDDSIYRVVPGVRFTYDSIMDYPNVINKKTYIEENLKENVYDKVVSEIDYMESKKLFMEVMTKILSDSTWLKQHIVEKLYLQVSGYDTFRFDFKRGVIREERIIRKGIYYIITMPSLVFVELIRNNITDWEEAFLSMRCQLERSFDKYNPLIVGFFRNLNVDRLNLIRDTIEQIISSDEMFEVNGCKVQRYCPHQHYDLKYHGVVSEDGKSITCLGHGWKWSLDSGEGINTRSNICVKNVS